jgi:site-specific DNA-methyltransferase (adenine-specific)
MRKNRYIPHVAGLHFKPSEDWTLEEAKKRFKLATFPFEVDHISYGNCVSGMRSLPRESVDCVIADPPFGLSFGGREAIYNRDERYVRRGYRDVQQQYEKFSDEWISQLPRVMKSTSSAWIFSGWTNLGDVLNAVKKSGLELVNHIIWKYQFGVFTRRKFVTSHYHLLFLAKSEDYYFNKVNHYPLDVWEINRTYKRGEVKNGTKLPEEIIKRCMDYSTKPGDLVLDPFMGNGTTAVVAKGTFRHFLGFEVNKKMRQVIESNLESAWPGSQYRSHVESLTMARN